MRTLLCLLVLAIPVFAQPDVPKASDPRLVVELFAAAPDIVHPIATDFDSKGRLLVVESHTHFAPANYKGPKFDRVRMLEDTDGDGKADKFTNFYEGTTHTMDLAVHPDGSVYLATRNQIIRLRDTKGTGTADEKTVIARLETTGNYPHNGLSGLTFDARGDLYFGMGENLGVPYKLIAADGSKFEGGGEGGNFFWITADGKKLRRVATGFWNPFGSCRDIFGRLFVVDNDPDASPPCRLLHVVEGGDYGYQFRYGRAGRHVFQAWNGELPGTLPMVAGTGESPCEVIAYESDGLPAEYLGNLLVPAWADHRVERYVLEPKGASFTSVRKPFIRGGKEFYPSGMTVAPDGSLYVTDWGSKSYELHGKGAVWRVRSKDKRHDPKDLRSGHRPLRDRAARHLASEERNRPILRVDGLKEIDIRERASALDALLAVGDGEVDLAKVARTDKVTGLRAHAVRGLVARKTEVVEFATKDYLAEVRAEAIAGLGAKQTNELLAFLSETDPFLRHTAIHRLGQLAEVLIQIDQAKFSKLDVKQRIGLLLAWRASRVENYAVIDQCLADTEPDVRLLAIKWISDEKLTGRRSEIEKMMKKPGVDAREFVGLATTLARLDDKPVNEDSLASYFLERAIDPKSPLTTRLLALRSIPAAFNKLKTDMLVGLLKDGDDMLKLEALRTLTERNDGKALATIRELLKNEKAPASQKAQAILTIPSSDPDTLLHLTHHDDVLVREEALRALAGAKPKKLFSPLLTEHESKLADRVMGRPFFKDRPPLSDTDAWLKRLEGPADADAGRRIFEHPRVASCAKCHRADGRGANIGPDLSLIGRTDRKWIVESILQPSAVVAPHYQAWQIRTLNERTLTGLLVGTQLDESVYIDPKGDRFKVLATEVAEVTPAKNSIMPDNMVDTLTDQELRDLIAYLTSRK